MRAIFGDIEIVAGEEAVLVVDVGGMADLEEEDIAVVEIALGRDDPIVASDTRQAGYIPVSIQWQEGMALWGGMYFESIQTGHCHSARA